MDEGLKTRFPNHTKSGANAEMEYRRLWAESELIRNRRFVYPVENRIGCFDNYALTRAYMISNGDWGEDWGLNLTSCDFWGNLTGPTTYIKLNVNGDGRRTYNDQAMQIRKRLSSMGYMSAISYNRVIIASNVFTNGILEAWILNPNIQGPRDLGFMVPIRWRGKDLRQPKWLRWRSTFVKDENGAWIAATPIQRHVSSIIVPGGWGKRK